jgi:phosphoribosylamine--glycine ligase
MRILVLGSGAREHAIVWKLKQSPLVTKIYCAPGNAGIGQISELVELVPTDVKAVVGFALRERVDLVVVGPEGPLAAGVADALEEEHIPVFGPHRNAALLESSKGFAKEFMHRHGVPTARYAVFTSPEQLEARAFLRHVNYPAVIKADGLAAGKGVIIVETEVFAVTDGIDYDVLATAQDHKRLLDGDRGKNTGGMGAYAPAPVVTEEVMAQVRKEIIEPVLGGLREENRTYRGVLYCGLMIRNNRARVVEFNVRFGDPEAEVVIPLLEGDFADLLLRCANGKLKEVMPLKNFDACAVTIVITSQGYPDSYETGKIIEGLDTFDQKKEIEEGLVVFHAATKLDEHDKVVTSGGRVLAVTAIGYGDELKTTITRAYNAVAQIGFDGAYYRSDIGSKAVVSR